MPQRKDVRTTSAVQSEKIRAAANIDIVRAALLMAYESEAMTINLSRYFELYIIYSRLLCLKFCFSFSF